MKNQVKVIQAEPYKDGQTNTIVCKGKLVLIDAPAGGTSNMLATGRLIDGIPMAQIPIIISATEKINVGDIYAMYLEKWNIMNPCMDEKEADRCNNHYSIKHNCRKILALPENFYPKHLQDIIDGKLQNEDEVLVECDPIPSAYDNPMSNPEGLHNAYSVYEIKLNNDNRVKLFPIEEKVSEYEIQSVAKETLKRVINENPLNQHKEENWDEICEKFNIQIADQEKLFVTATQFFNWLKNNYNPPTKK